MSDNVTNHRVERQVRRVLGDAVVSTPARRVCHDAGVEHRAAAVNDIVTGRRRIAHEIGKSERQVSRLVRAGVLPATRCDQPNRPLAVRSADLGKVR